jgi:hypothetical protein
MDDRRPTIFELHDLTLTYVGNALMRIATIAVGFTAASVPAHKKCKQHSMPTNTG